MDYKTAKELFDYNPETGVLTWRVGRGSRTKIGGVAGSINGRGYRIVGAKKKYYQAHRVAWLLSTGEWPKNGIDHINGVPDDNRFANLREATQGENQQNKKAASNTGVTGVHLDKRGYYQAQLKVNGKKALSVSFKSFDRALAAITAAKRKYHTFHPEVVTR
jgi:hypothetical protein